MNNPKSLSEVQIRDLSRHLESRCGPKHNGLRDYLLFSIMLHCGLRVGELVQLILEMVTLEGVPLESIQLAGSITKTKVARSVPVPKIVKGSLTQYLRLTYPCSCDHTNFLFPSPNSHTNHLTVRTVQLMISSASKKALGSEISPHVLRHTYATRMMRLTDLPTLQALLGHASVTSTQVYTHPSNQDMVTAADKLNVLNRDL